MQELRIRVPDDQYEALREWKREKGYTWRGALIAGSPLDSRELVTDGGRDRLLRELDPNDWVRLETPKGMSTDPATVHLVPARGPSICGTRNGKTVHPKSTPRDAEICDECLDGANLEI